MKYDVAVVGGGLIGAACADTLAGEGWSVCLLDAGAPGREASWAGAGLLHPIHPWHYPEPLHLLLRAALAEHERCAADLLDRTGIDVELERSGLVVMDPELDRLEAWCGPEAARHVDAAAEEPRIRHSGPALLVPGAYHVRNHRLNRAFLEGARRRGATVLERTPVTGLVPGAVQTEKGRIEASWTVLAAGAWASRLMPGLLVEPIRGQILLYEGSMRRVVVFPKGEYAVPRRNGLILFGSTLEKAGFAPLPTDAGVLGLQERARELLGLDPDDLRAAWAGLRPGTSHLLPYMGTHPERSDLILACGHYRNGILLAPLTAGIVADIVAGRPPAFDLAPFRPDCGESRSS